MGRERKHIKRRKKTDVAFFNTGNGGHHPAFAPGSQVSSPEKRLLIFRRTENGDNIYYFNNRYKINVLMFIYIDGIFICRYHVYLFCK